jgi:hypothetical protein
MFKNDNSAKNKFFEILPTDTLSCNKLPKVIINRYIDPSRYIYILDYHDGCPSLTNFEQTDPNTLVEHLATYKGHVALTLEASKSRGNKAVPASIFARLTESFGKLYEKMLAITTAPDVSTQLQRVLEEIADVKATTTNSTTTSKGWHSPCMGYGYPLPSPRTRSAPRAG